MSKRMTATKIIADMRREAPMGGALTERDRGFNSAISTELKGKRAANYEGNEQYFWEGRFINPMTEHEIGYNEGYDAVQAFKAGEEGMTEKNEDQRRFDLRRQCFTMAQQQAPRRMNGADPEPPAETIRRAMFLEHYFVTGQLLELGATPTPVKSKAK